LTASGATDPLSADTDGDGLRDGFERTHGFDPNDADENDNNLPDGADDRDGDGSSNADEADAGSDPDDPNDTPAGAWHTITGDNPVDEPKTATKTYTIKKGESRLVVVGVTSDEYPEYTGTPSVWDDLLEWEITPSTGYAITGSLYVNDRHDDWVIDEINGVTLNGFGPSPPVHVEQVKIIHAPPNADVTVTVKLTATNISDGTLPSTVIVGLLPVDLDIEYGSQTGVLDDSKEDVGDGGYISLKSQTHQGEDITPTTYLVIRPTAGLPADGKVRLKFNSGGRYKVARDRLGNDPIVSEVTEFPAGQETRLYLVGETKSQARGGEQITMQINANGTWIDGDSLKATVVQTQFQIDLRVFIPYNWVNIPHPAHVFQVAKGDSRSYDPDLNGTYRVAQLAIVNLYREWVPEVENRMIENWKSAGVSEHYSNSDVLNWDDGAKHSDDTDVSPSYINSGAAVINSGTADISRVDSFIESVGPMGSSDDTKTFMKFTGAAAEPIIAGAADIDWRIFVGISKNDPLNPQFVMQGVHDGFPAYEIYINSNHQIFQHTNVLQWKPNPSAGVLELISFPDVTVGTATGLIEQ
jgi:hypothetical protein